VVSRSVGRKHRFGTSTGRSRERPSQLFGARHLYGHGNGRLANQALACANSVRIERYLVRTSDERRASRFPRDSDPVAVGNVNAPLWLADYEGPTPLNWIHVLVENAGTFNVENVRVKATFNSPGGAGAAAAWKPV